MWIKKSIFSLLVVTFAVGGAPSHAKESLTYDPYSVDEEGLNLKEFNSGESFYLWTTFSVKVT